MTGSAGPTIPVLTAGSPVTEVTGYRENLPVTERSAAPTIPVLTAGSPVTEFTGYRENLPVTQRSAAPTIPVLTAGSPVTEFTGYRENLPVTSEGIIYRYFNIDRYVFLNFNIDTKSGNFNIVSITHQEEFSK